MRSPSTESASIAAQLKRPLLQLWRMGFTGACLMLTAIAAGLDGALVQRWERQVQTGFFELRGPRPAPENVIILAIDEESLAQAEYYQDNPQRNPALEPIQQWPWQRRAYAIAIDRIMAAGAKAVAVDVVFSTESGYGPADDEALTAVLDRYGDRVVLAAFQQTSELRQGSLNKPTLPIAAFQNTGIRLGAINFPIEPDGRIHRQGHTYRSLVADQLPEAGAIASPDTDSGSTLVSFAEATLAAAQVTYPTPRGTGINFLGPAYTFKQVPFWYVLDTDPWSRYLQNGAVFQDKIVIIGSTASLHQDFHAAPFSKTFAYPTPMAGVEVIANDIATLQAGTAMRRVLPAAWQRSLFVLIVSGGYAAALSLRRRTLHRIAWAIAVCGGWLILSFVAFWGGLLLPTAVTTLGLLSISGSHIAVGIVAERVRKQRLRATLAQYVTSPIVQEIISQEEDFQDLLAARQAQVIGLVLGGRYQVVRLLGSGGFGETYVAEDTQRPGQPICVVKQLKIISDDPKVHHLARRLFMAEAETLERLGDHDQIPRLLAHFEANHAFYVVEEMVEGSTLKDELVTGQPKSQRWVVDLLQDLLTVIEFVHSQGVIHRDIKPSNVIRRALDQRLVLIDFGSVKQISNQLTDTEAQITSTIGIGTKGYMPSEQSAGLPRFNSDLYALGVMAIEALTGMSPYQMTYDDRGELVWQYQVTNLHPGLGKLLTQLVRYDFSERYGSAAAVLADLAAVITDFETNPHWRMVAQTPQILIAEPFEGDHEDRTTDILPEDWQKMLLPTTMEPLPDGAIADPPAS